MNFLSFLPTAYTKVIDADKEGTLTTFILLYGYSIFDNDIIKTSKENFESLKATLKISSEHKRHKNQIGIISLSGQKTIADIEINPHLTIDVFCSQIQFDALEKEIFRWLDNKQNFEASFNIEYSGFEKDKDNSISKSSIESFIESRLALHINNFQMRLNSITN